MHMFWLEGCTQQNVNEVNQALANFPEKLPIGYESTKLFAYFILIASELSQDVVLTSLTDALLGVGVKPLPVSEYSVPTPQHSPL